MFKKFFSFFLFSFLLLLSQIFALDAVFYNLPVFDLELNQINELNLSDYLLVLPDEIQDIIFPEQFDNKISSLKFLPDKKSILIETNNDGFVELPITIKTKEKSIEQILFLSIKQSKYHHTFLYKGKSGLKVSVAGEFNGWNMNANIMNEIEEGKYSLSMDLKPGKYKYKFVINGKDWIPDELNPLRSDDGWNNSVLVLGKSYDINYDVIAINKKKTDNGILFSFKINVLNNPNETSKLFFLINNKILKKIDDFKNSIVDCFVPDEYLKKSQESEYDNYVYKLNILIVPTENDYHLKSYYFEPENNLFNWKDAILYFAFTDRFYNYENNFDYKVKGDISDKVNFHGGNFKGITKKIQDGYFSDLGVSAIWISPVFENPRDTVFAGYHGYWPIDSYKIAQNFGTLDDLKELVSEAHKKNIRIIVDYVAKHIFKDNPLYKEHPEYFGTLDLPDGRKNIGLFDEFPLSTWFGDYLPAFNFQNPDAVNFLVNNALWLIKETNIDGFRLDAVKHIEHNLFKELRKRIKYEIELPQKKVFYMVGESMTSREKIMEYVKFYEMNGQFDFPLYWDIRKFFAADLGSFYDINNNLKEAFKVYGSEALMSTMLGNHDFSRFMAYADNKFKPDSVDEQEYGWKHNVVVDDPANYKKLKLAFSFLMTIPGVPLIYYGDEFGMTGAHDPDNRRVMRFDDELTEHEKDVLNYVKKINSIRNKFSAFRYGDFIPLYIENELFAYCLSNFDKKAIVVLSRHKEGNEIKINLPAEFNMKQLKNAFTDEIISIENNTLLLNVTPYSCFIFVNE
ncbi:MAG TPA: alpha-amylase family glycosyl hydrolase [bacterium]|nr:alpha-amylase family glycosyl hydrolase [bacterium]HOL47863.1 alpha-amylase family glycosyl hydrolase [bacterium]HPQ17902.1 alpha-amylase family glycosyl hydrolase [bacterium]